MTRWLNILFSQFYKQRISEWWQDIVLWEKRVDMSRSVLTGCVHWMCTYSNHLFNNIHSCTHMHINMLRCASNIYFSHCLTVVLYCQLDCIIQNWSVNTVMCMPLATNVSWMLYVLHNICFASEAFSTTVFSLYDIYYAF